MQSTSRALIILFTPESHSPLCVYLTRFPFHAFASSFLRWYSGTCTNTGQPNTRNLLTPGFRHYQSSITVKLKRFEELRLNYLPPEPLAHLQILEHKSRLLEKRAVHDERFGSKRLSSLFPGHARFTHDGLLVLLFALKDDSMDKLSLNPKRRKTLQQ